MTDPIVLTDSIVHCELPQLVSWAGLTIALAIVGIGIRQQAIHKMASTALNKQTAHLDSLKDLRTMHEHADDFGFGTKATNERLDKLLTAITASTEESQRVSDSLYRLVHYITFDIKSRTGKAPPPPPPNGGK